MLIISITGSRSFQTQVLERSLLVATITGRSGVDGVDGDTGPAGRGVTGVTINPATGALTFTYTDDTEETTDALGDVNGWNEAADQRHTHANMEILDEIDADAVAAWSAAYGWGNHADAGYLLVETDPVFGASPAATITNLLISNWNASYTASHAALTLGASPNGLSLAAGQILSMALADGTNIGAVSISAQTFAGSKTFSGSMVTFANDMTFSGNAPNMSHTGGGRMRMGSTTGPVTFQESNTTDGVLIGTASIVLSSGGGFEVYRNTASTVTNVFQNAGSGNSILGINSGSGNARLYFYRAGTLQHSITVNGVPTLTFSDQVRSVDYLIFSAYGRSVAGAVYTATATGDALYTYAGTITGTATTSQVFYGARFNTTLKAGANTQRFYSAWFDASTNANGFTGQTAYGWGATTAVITGSGNLDFEEVVGNAFARILYRDASGMGIYTSSSARPISLGVGFAANWIINTSGNLTNSGSTKISLAHDAIATSTLTYGLELFNSTAATAGITRQNSAGVAFRGAVWNTTTLASNTVDGFIYLDGKTDTTSQIESRIRFKLGVRGSYVDDAFFYWKTGFANGIVLSVNTISSENQTMTLQPRQNMTVETNGSTSGHLYRFTTNAGIITNPGASESQFMHWLQTFAATSSANYAMLKMEPTLTQPGGTGIYRGIWIAGTVSALDYRAIETTDGKVILGGTSIHAYLRTHKLTTVQRDALTGLASGEIVYNTTTGTHQAYNGGWKEIYNVTAFDLEVTDSTKGLILKSPDGTRWRVSVDNAGVISAAAA
jgi:hypothetical protein